MSLDLNVLNDEQKSAVEQIEGPCMIIAGAGSGKTRVLTYKIAYLIDSGINPFEILALTFTNKAADEMKERIKVLASHGADKLWMGTFHSIFARILRFEAEKIGFTRNFSIYDTDDSINLLRQVMKENDISTEKFSPRGIQSAISYLKNKLITPQGYSEIAKTQFEKIVESIYPEYQKSLLKNNSMDFDDLLMKPIELFTGFPEVLQKYSSKFRFILVDEYQDTNKAQYIIVKMLAQGHRNISVVGDDAQSIYKWRGAEIQNIFDFESDFIDRKLFRLEQNYRSTKNILTLAGYVISKNLKQIEKNLWTENKPGEQVSIVENLTDNDEASRITRQISTEIHRQKLNFKDVAVLYRTNAQSRMLEESLRKNSIPYIIIGGVRFYQRKEIKDVLCQLRIIVNKNDEGSLIRFLGLKQGIGKTTIERLISSAREKDKQLFEIISGVQDSTEFSSRMKNSLLEVLNFIRKYEFLKNDITLPEIISSIIDESGIIQTLRLENTLEAEERINNIKEFISASADYYDTVEDASLENFLQQVSLVADIDELDNKKNAVTLMTLHAAKGLEFSVVFITGLEEGLFPVQGSMNSDEELEEERRLFYVGITRAKKKLYLSFANQRRKYGIVSYQVRSRFLREIENDIEGKDLIYFEGLKPLRGKKSYNFIQEKKFNSGISINYEYIEQPHSDDSEEYFDDSFQDIIKGVSVYHNTFGKGVVISVIGKGMDKKANILFEGIGLKKIILKYAKMRV